MHIDSALVTRVNDAILSRRILALKGIVSEMNTKGLCVFRVAFYYLRMVYRNSLQNSLVVFHVVLLHLSNCDSSNGPLPSI